MVLLNVRDPFEATISREISKLQNEMNTLFERFFGRSFPFTRVQSYPAVNIYHDNDNVYVTAELPGIRIEDLDITLEEDSLTIKGQRVSDSGDDISYHRKEREEGQFNRVISLPVTIVPESAKATLKNGVLLITLPKAEEAKPKKIEIKLG